MSTTMVSDRASASAGVPVGQVSRWLSVLLVCALALLGAGCTGAGSGPGGPSASAPDREEPSPWAVFLDGRVSPEGELDRDAALQAFSFAMAPLPEVELPPGPRDGVGSGTLAVRWLRNHWQEITPDQRTAAAAAMSAQPAAPQVPNPGKPAQPASSGCTTANGPGTEKFVPLLDAQVAAIGAHLGRTLRLKTYVVKDSKPPSDAPTALMWADPCGENDTSYTTCTVHVTPNALAGRNEDDWRGDLTHEATHCYLRDKFGTSVDRLAVWLDEGFSEWVTATLTRDRHSTTWWSRYLLSQDRPLFKRAYSAIGYWMHLAESGSDPWTHIDPMVAAWVKAGGRKAMSEANKAAWEAGEPKAEFLDSWASGFARGRFPGRAWDVTGPNVPSTQPPLDAPVVGNGDAVNVSAPAGAVRLAKMDVQAEVVTFSASKDAHGRLGPGNGVEQLLDTVGGKVFCTRSTPCSCPKGTPNEHTQFYALPRGQTFLGVTGGLAAAEATAKGVTLDDYCKQASCQIGSWRSTEFSMTMHQLDGRASGGAGVTLVINPNGDGEANYDPMSPITFTAREGVAGEFIVSGVATGHVDLPPPGVTSGPWTGRSTGGRGFSMTGRMTSPFNLTLFDHLTADQVGGAGAYGAIGGTSIFGNWTFECGRDSLVLHATLTNGDEGTWRLTRS